MPIIRPITITLNPSPSFEAVEAFYDRALCSLAQGYAAYGDPCPTVTARYHARLLTEERFGVKLVLPGDGE